MGQSNLIGSWDAVGEARVTTASCTGWPDEFFTVTDRAAPDAVVADIKTMVATINRRMKSA
jgi:hypothetical protein